MVGTFMGLECDVVARRGGCCGVGLRQVDRDLDVGIAVDDELAGSQWQQCDG